MILPSSLEGCYEYKRDLHVEYADMILANELGKMTGEELAKYIEFDFEPRQDGIADKIYELTR